MAKRPRPAKHPSPSTAGEIGPRQPCPCGSGRRYKACHGASGHEAPYVMRAFQGLPGECDWVALREFVQAGSATLTLLPTAYDGLAADMTVQAASVLPGVAPALRRPNGDVWIGVQVAHRSGDPSTDLARAVGLGLGAAPGEAVSVDALAGPGTRLQDVVDPKAEFVVTVHDGFDFWFDEAELTDDQIAATLAQVNEQLTPSARLSSVTAAYWTSSGTREQLLWVLPHDEDRLLTALARMRAAGVDSVVDGARLIGSYRSHGLLVPVWDLPDGTGAEALEEPAAALAGRLDDALADDSPLSAEVRAARNGLANRQLTVR